MRRSLMKWMESNWKMRCSKIIKESIILAIATTEEHLRLPLTQGGRNVIMVVAGRHLSCQNTAFVHSNHPIRLLCQVVSLLDPESFPFSVLEGSAFLQSNGVMIVISSPLLTGQRVRFLLPTKSLPLQTLLTLFIRSPTVAHFRTPTPAPSSWTNE